MSAAKRRRIERLLDGALYRRIAEVWIASETRRWLVLQVYSALWTPGWACKLDDDYLSDLRFSINEGLMIEEEFPDALEAWKAIYVPKKRDFGYFHELPFFTDAIKFRNRHLLRKALEYRLLSDIRVVDIIIAQQQRLCFGALPVSKIEHWVVTDWLETIDEFMRIRTSQWDVARVEREFVLLHRVFQSFGLDPLLWYGHEWKFKSKA